MPDLGTSPPGHHTAPTRILLTGAGGFVGRHLAAALATRYPRAQLTGCTGGATSGASPEGTVVDLRSREETDALVRGTDADLVVHLAAQSSVARGAGEGDLTWSVNLVGTINLALSVARHTPAATILFASTAEVYGATFLEGPATEQSALAPLSPYARSKALAEQALAEILPRTARLVVVRPGNHAGPGQQPTFVLPSFAAQVARIEAGLDGPTLRVGNLDVRRDFLHVDDVVAAYLALVGQAAALPRRFTVNVGSGEPLALRDIVDRLKSLSPRAFAVAVDPDRLRPVDVPSAALDASLLRALTGWRPARTVDDILRDLLATARASVSRPD